MSFSIEIDQYFIQKRDGDCARLSNIVDVVVDVVFQSKFTPALLLENKDIASLLEQLFSHFFSADRPDYNSDDVQWFLELANSQNQWSTMKVSWTRINVDSYDQTP